MQRVNDSQMLLVVVKCNHAAVIFVGCNVHVGISIDIGIGFAVALVVDFGVELYFVR